MPSFFTPDTHSSSDKCCSLQHALWILRGIQNKTEQDRIAQDISITAVIALMVELACLTMNNDQAFFLFSFFLCKSYSLNSLTDRKNRLMDFISSMCSSSILPVNEFEYNSVFQHKNNSISIIITIRNTRANQKSTVRNRSKYNLFSRQDNYTTIGKKTPTIKQTKTITKKIVYIRVQSFRYHNCRNNSCLQPETKMTQKHSIPNSTQNPINIYFLMH